MEVGEGVHHPLVLVEDGWVCEEVVTLGVVEHNILGQVGPVVFIKVELVEYALLRWGHVFFFEH